MIFTVTDKDFFKENPWAKGVKEFNELDSLSMKYIALVYDIQSPLVRGRLPIEERKRQAISIAGFEPTPKGRPSKQVLDLTDVRTQAVANAIKKYKEIQFDDDLDTLEAYSEQLTEFKEILRKKGKEDKDLDRALKIMKEYPNLVELKKILAEKLSIKIEESSLEDLDEDEASDIEDYFDEFK
jgi:hypothetical protein